jgi:4-amino-4-deoxy-L-arabinose transferase-like glycosyltransferase
MYPSGSFSRREKVAEGADEGYITFAMFDTGIQSVRPLLVAWIAFVSAGIFLALLTPLGEGLDEPWHFAYVQHVAQTHSAPLGHSKFVSTEIERFLRNHPGSWALHTNFPIVQTYEDYWAQPSEDRSIMDRTIRDLRFSGTYEEAEVGLAWQYENHQPPLYYILTAPVFSASARLFSFTDTFLLIRIWTVLIASLIVPAMWMLVRQVFDEKGPRDAALLTVVVFPGLYPGVVRVSNDALMAVLAAWLFFVLVRYLKTEQPRYLYALAALIVAGLWTKAFFVPILAGTVLALLSFGKVRPAFVVVIASVLGWPWYIVNYRFSGAITGLPETVLGHTTVATSLQALWMLDWRNFVVVLRASHIWIGNWSLLGVRSWMYEVISWLFCLGLLGFIRKPARFLDRTIRPLALLYIVFIAALIYYATQVFLHKGVTVAEGWYLTSFISIESILFVAGAYALLGARGQGRWLVSSLSLCCMALVVYSGLFVALPYYSGITHHNPSGGLASFHPAMSDFTLMASRLMRYQPGIPHVLPWLLLLTFVSMSCYCILRMDS